MVGMYSKPADVDLTSMEKETKYWKMQKEELLRGLDSSERGLSEAEAARSAR